MRDEFLVQRRTFLRQASLVALIPVLDFGLFGLTGCANSSQSTSAAESDKRVSNLPSRTVIVSDKEQGEPLIVSGTIYSSDGRAPMKDINLYVYQTDATGRYSTSGGDNRNTRIHGAMKTGEDGRYEFRTIKPVSYPNSTIPAHIHAYISGPDYPEYWIDEYWFDDDRFISQEQRKRVAEWGSFSPILTLTRGADGVLRGTRDIKIERCSRNCTGK